MRRLILITLGLFGGALATPLSLETAWTLVTPALQTANLKQKTAEMAYQKALAGMGPTLQLTGNLSLTGTFEPQTDSSSGTLSGKASWDLAPWSAAKVSLRTAGRDLQSAQLDHQVQVSEARLQITEKYFQVEQARAQLELARLQVEVKRLALQTAEQKRQLGQATEDGVEGARLDLLQAQITLQSRQNTLQGALQSLSMLLGTAVQEGDTTEPTLVLPAFSDLKLLLQQADRHPTVQKARLVLQAREDAVEAQKLSAALPDLTVTGKFGNLSGGWNVSTDFSLQAGRLGVAASYPLGATGQNSLGYSVGLQVNVPLDGQQPYTLQSLIHQQELQLLAVQDALNTVQQNIISQYHLYLEQVQQLEASTLRLRQSENQLEVQQKRLSLGLVTRQDVLAAELDLKTAQADLKQTTRQAHLQALKLRLATGEPYENADPHRVSGFHLPCCPPRFPAGLGEHLAAKPRPAKCPLRIAKCL